MYRLVLIQIIFVISTFASQVMALSTGLRWPVKCTPGVNCQLGLPDIENTNQTSLCTKPGVPGHEGTDIGARPGTEVYAAADGVVRWAFDGAADRCSTKDINHPDCQKPTTEAKAGQSDGYRRCTPAEECDDKSMGCFWCFYGGNVIVLRHSTTPGVSGTRYDHLKKGSLLVKPGDIVKKGQLIALSGDSGNTSGPHLHFEIWGEKTYQPLDPWRGPCSSKTATTLWESDTPWIRK